MIVAGIDPGKSGAMVILLEAPVVHRVPLMKKGKVQPAWSAWARSWASDMFGIDRIVIEQVAARPGQGVSSMFSFGRCYGFAHALAALSGAEVHFVTPPVWKAKFGLLKADKNASREVARQRIPALAPELTRVKDDGVAEAALLALYGQKYL